MNHKGNFSKSSCKRAPPISLLDGIKKYNEGFSAYKFKQVDDKSSQNDTSVELLFLKQGKEMNHNFNFNNDGDDS